MAAAPTSRHVDTLVSRPYTPRTLGAWPSSRPNVHPTREARMPAHGCCSGEQGHPAIRRCRPRARHAALPRKHDQDRHPYPEPSADRRAVPDSPDARSVTRLAASGGIRSGIRSAASQLLPTVVEKPSRPQLLESTGGNHTRHGSAHPGIHSGGSQGLGCYRDRCMPSANSSWAEGQHGAV